MYPFDILSQDSLEIDDILSSIDNLTQYEEQQIELCNTINKPDLESVRKDMEEKGFVDSQIQEALTGLEQNLPIQVYARDCYNWKQMRELRLGLLDELDVHIYENPHFSAEQMQEIRLGLNDKLDVESYAKLIYTAKDMSRIRKKLLSEVYVENPKSFAKEIIDEDSQIKVRISDDCMKAYITVPNYTDCTMYDLKRILNKYDVVFGISMDALKNAVDNNVTDKEILAAEGRPPVAGRNGRYDFLFNKLLPESPKTREDGSVDYVNVVVADRVTQGAPLAKYRPATEGQPGETVTGVPLESKHGTDLPPFTGKGIMRDIKENMYIAAADGFVFMDEVQHVLNVWDVFVVEGDINRYNGNITYDGIIHIKGSVSDMAVITASGDIVIDGFLESAMIQAGGNVILKDGVNAGGKGYIHAGGKVMGKFFEYAHIEARGRVEGNYFLDCDIQSDDSVVARGNKSRIMGGHIQAGRYIESAVIGNYSSSHTILEVGHATWINQKMQIYEKKLEAVLEELEQLEAGRDKLDSVLGTDISQNNRLFQKTCLAIQIKEDQKLALEREINYYDNIKALMHHAYVKATTMLEEGVQIYIGGSRKHVGKNINGITLKASK